MSDPTPVLQFALSNFFSHENWFLLSLARGKIVCIAKAEMSDEKVSEAQQPLVSLSDVTSLVSLRDSIRWVRQKHDRCLHLLDESRVVLANNHSAQSMSNVYMLHSIEEARQRISAKHDAIRLLERDVEAANLEHDRLSEINTSLLQAIQEKELEKERLIARLQAHVRSDRDTQGLGNAVNSRTEALEEEKGSLLHTSSQLMSRMGKHHGHVMRLEQKMIDLRLELDSLRAKHHLPPLGSSLVNSYVMYLGACDNAACIKVRHSLRAAKEKLALLKQRDDARRSPAPLFPAPAIVPESIATTHERR